MRAWIALFKKDFKLTRTVCFVGLIINFLIAMLTLYVGRDTTGNTLFMFIPLAVAVVFHILYFPIIVFISLKTEANQLHLWLHNPQPARTLLFSKIVNGLMMMTISLLTLYVMTGLLIIPNFNLIEAYWTDVWMAGLFMFLHIIMFSLVIGIWVIFLWTLYHYLKFKIGRWSWLVVIGAVIGPCWINALFESTKLYNLLVEWGSMTYTYNFPFFSENPTQVYAGEYLYNTLIIIGLFYLSAWFNDKKIEV